MTEYGSGGSFEVVMDGPYSSGGGTVSGESKLTTISAPASKWKGGASPYSQVVDVYGISVNTKVEIALSAETIQHFLEADQDIAFTAANDGGTVTLYAIGSLPGIDLTFQAVLTEVISL